MGKLSKIIFSSLFLGTCVPHYQTVPPKNLATTEDYLEPVVPEAEKETIIEKKPLASLPKKLSLCPKNMVSIEEEYCIDKWEASIVDKNSGIPASPQYIADHQLAEKQYFTFKNLKANEDKLNSHVGLIEEEFSKEWIIFSQEELKKIFDMMAEMPARGSESNHGFEPKAICSPNVKPASYVSRDIAEKACDSANKRLCTADEWYKACAGPNTLKPFINKKGEKEFPNAYPYGENYQIGKCNIGLLKDRMWPPGLLGRKNNGEMRDPRIANLLGLDSEPMIKDTGSFPECVSGYGVYDMVGNMHEIVADTIHRRIQRATYLGSHFARDPNESCGEVTQGHWIGYTDYSIGFRCCKDIR